MKIKLTSVMVDDQDKALKFYTEVLGFVKKTDIPCNIAYEIWHIAIVQGDVLESAPRNQDAPRPRRGPSPPE